MNSAALSRIIRERSQRLRNPDEEPSTVGQLAEDGELLLVLARVIEGKSVQRAFGSPGDWGYNTPIGRALAQSEEAGPPVKPQEALQP